jgi:tetratricopeptide (TPR) repeat protein
VWAYDYSILVFDEFAPAHFNMGNAFLTLGKYHQAIERFKVAMELDGDDAMALCYLGEAHEQLQEYDLAKNYYHLSLELEPELPEAWLGLGIISDIEGKTKEGIVLLKKALSFDLNSASIHLVLANAYHKSNERELAETHFLKSLSLDALDSESLSDYVFFVMEESVQDALKYLEENQHEMEQNSVFLQMLVHVLVTLKKFKEAALIFSSIVATNIEQAKELLEWNPKLLNRKEFVNLMNE